MNEPRPALKSLHAQWRMIIHGKMHIKLSWTATAVDLILPHIQRGRGHITASEHWSRPLSITSSINVEISKCTRWIVFKFGKVINSGSDPNQINFPCRKPKVRQNWLSFSWSHLKLIPWNFASLVITLKFGVLTIFMRFHRDILLFNFCERNISGCSG